MKILKISIIILLPALGIVGCKKSDVKPANPATSTSTAATTNDNSALMNARSFDDAISEGDGGDKSTTIIGSGDDDRDGGDKKAKKITR